MNYLSTLPDKTALLDWQKERGNNDIAKVNAHIHTPYSFSAFKNIPQIFEMARQEEIKVLGINDFYTTDGYAEFIEQAHKNKVFPLFNIEFIALDLDDQKKGRKVNDPGNPGRTYLSGKGLLYPPKLDEPFVTQLNTVQAETLKQVEAMVEKVQHILINMGSDIKITMAEIFEKYAVDQVRERHIAKIIRVKVFEKYTSSSDRKAFLEKLYGGKASTADLSDNSLVENEIRGMLLKAGGSAFVEEDPKAFLSVPQVKAIILNAGGIPTYPLLADNAKGEYTDFENDKEKLLQELKVRGINSIEFIPNRNDLKRLKEYARFFWDNQILVTFGTEHNTPEMIPLTIETRGHVDLDHDLKELSYQGACVVAAHQYLMAKGQTGFVKSNGHRNGDRLQPFVKLGHAVVSRYLTFLNKH
ncbi:PHP domain-containing protein [Saccharicrinis carchari]|uniref:PHP domain-containing protein n=1 Tax=Saccharicrinis carchari TaxID=1168039 RepID=A0A521DFA7_SACCC|nr:PHP domain-containing protein [Saccharicrinis carchari]SMO69821.1 PHP domain-containing protein [Saccharicrinis carchari]